MLGRSSGLSPIASLCQTRLSPSGGPGIENLMSTRPSACASQHQTATLNSRARMSHARPAGQAPPTTVQQSIEPRLPVSPRTIPPARALAVRRSPAGPSNNAHDRGPFNNAHDRRLVSSQ